MSIDNQVETSEQKPILDAVSLLEHWDKNPRQRLETSLSILDQIALGNDQFISNPEARELFLQWFAAATRYRTNQANSKLRLRTKKEIIHAFATAIYFEGLKDASLFAKIALDQRFTYSDDGAKSFYYRNKESIERAVEGLKKFDEETKL